MIKTSISLTTAALFGLGLWLIIPQSVKWLAELFQLLLLCHLCFLMGLESGRYQCDLASHFQVLMKSFKQYGN